MKKAYLLTFSNSLGTQEEVKECLDTISAVEIWRYDMLNAFYIISEDNAERIFNQIKRHFNNNGRFIIAEITDNSQGWLTNKSWYLIENKEIKEG
ncbi:MAG: hypothetical protein JSV30_01455 [Candidatus Omnitrophota bacterium]|nr:MAG: hypothetical protein JSV30_01455 [Candidatus Omnitrophota bacterium]